MAGAGYKLFASGDVLTAAQVNTYLQEQAVMVFASAAARTTAISGVLAEGMVTYLQDTNTMEVYDGANWIPASLTNSFYAGKNKVLNANFGIWARGTSFTAGTTAIYTADRWQSYRAALGSTITRQLTNDTTNLPNIQYCARIARDSGNTSTSPIYYSQSLETVNSIPYAGQTVTVSFYARAGANFSMASNALGFQLTSGTGTDQNVVSGFTGGSNIVNTTVTLTTTWQRFTRTVAVPSNTTQLALSYILTPVGTAGANDYFEITGVQLEAGSTATAFQTATGNQASELAACQRYYYRQSIQATPARFALGMANSTTSAIFIIHFPVQMRTAPTALEQSGTAGDYSVVSSGTTITNCSAVPSFGTASTNVGDVTFTVASGLTAGQALTARPVNTNAYLGWSAEL